MLRVSLKNANTLSDYSYNFPFSSGFSMDNIQYNL